LSHVNLPSIEQRLGRTRSTCAFPRICWRACYLWREVCRPRHARRRSGWMAGARCFPGTRAPWANEVVAGADASIECAPCAPGTNRERTVEWVFLLAKAVMPSRRQMTSAVDRRDGRRGRGVAANSFTINQLLECIVRRSPCTTT
jgi:hypothetical protein